MMVAVTTRLLQNEVVDRHGLTRLSLLNIVHIKFNSTGNGTLLTCNGCGYDEIKY